MRAREVLATCRDVLATCGAVLATYPRRTRDVPATYRDVMSRRPPPNRYGVRYLAGGYVVHSDADHGFPEDGLDDLDGDSTVYFGLAGTSCSRRT